MHSGLRNDIDDLAARWPELNLGSGLRSKLPKQVEHAIAEYCDRPENLYGREAGPGTVKKARKMLRHLKSAAVRTTMAGTPEARAARKLLTSLHHLRDFEAMYERARDYARRLKRLEKRRAKRAPVCEARSIHLGAMDALGEVYLQRLVSVADLQKTGGQLGLCVAGNDRYARKYHRRLRKKKTEFWTLRAKAPIALLEVTRRFATDHGKFVECGTASKCGVSLPRSMLVRLGRALDPQFPDEWPIQEDDNVCDIPPFNKYKVLNRLIASEIPYTGADDCSGVGLGHQIKIVSAICCGRKLLAIGLFAPGGEEFGGEALLGAMRSQGLKFGAMNIFHRFDPVTGTIQFSVADAVEPGYFDLFEISSQVFPGLVFYLHLSRPDHPAKAVEDMIGVAREIAGTLGGVLKDANMNEFTPQAAERYRARVIDYERRCRG